MMLSFAGTVLHDFQAEPLRVDDAADTIRQTALFQFSFDPASDSDPPLDASGWNVGESVTLWYDPAAPVVPMDTATLLLPPATHITRVEISYSDEGWVLDPTLVPIAPVPANLSTDRISVEVDGWTTERFERWQSFGYLTYISAGHRLGTVWASPVAYDAAQQKLVYHDSALLTITVEQVPWPDDDSVSPRATSSEDIAEVVVNPKMLATYSSGSLLSEPQSLRLPSLGSYEYVIVTGSALASSFQSLLNHKIGRGLTGQMVTTEYIGANYSGTETGDLADKIRQFVRDAHENWGTRWVLLGGDTEIIPHRGVRVSYSTYQDNALPTDLYYACLDGPWNSNGDSLWGELMDGAGGQDIDLAPDVHVGRAPVSNTAEAANFVAKALLYESTRHPNFKSALWLGEKIDDTPTWGSTSGIDIRNDSMPSDWTIVEYYDAPGYTWSKTSLINEINSGVTTPHLINSLGHSAATIDSRLQSADVRALVNSAPYFLYSQGCNAGAFDNNLSIAEEHVVNPYGAFGVVMNSRLGWYASGTSLAYSHYYAKEFWDAAFNEGKVSLADANDDSKMDNLFRVGDPTGIYRWIHFTLNLLGDPETPLQIGHLGEIHGSVWGDSDGDGTHDAGEPGLAGRSLFLDINGNGLHEEATTTMFTQNTPLATVQNSTVSSSLAVTGLNGLISDVNVVLSISHTYAADLDVVLISPRGTQVRLFNRVGGSGDHFTDTLLDDEASTYIGSGSAPFAGAYRPKKILASFDGEDPNGTWILQITDSLSSNTGTLNNWKLEFVTEEPLAVTDAMGNYTFGALPASTYEVRHLIESGEQHTNPTSGSQAVAVADGQIATDVDFGLLTGSSQVVGRHIFYNRSAFDGNDAGPSEQDDGAIPSAAEKQALLPGETATFANYTSYWRGINGIMVDIENLPLPSSLTAADFLFRVGNSGDLATWADAPPPASVTVRQGAGTGGSHRVTLIWPDNQIEKQWLQVTVLDTAHTGLAAGTTDVFYFGNAIGEAGDSLNDAKVNATDEIAARNNPALLGHATIDNRYDFNRDSKVDATDQIIARNNQTFVANALKLIAVPAPAPLGESLASGLAWETASAAPESASETTLAGEPLELLEPPLESTNAAEPEPAPTLVDRPPATRGAASASASSAARAAAVPNAAGSREALPEKADQRRQTRLLESAAIIPARPTAPELGQLALWMAAEESEGRISRSKLRKREVEAVDAYYSMLASNL